MTKKKKYADPPHLTDAAEKYYKLLMKLLEDEQGFKEIDTYSVAILASAFSDYHLAGLEKAEQGLFYSSAQMRRTSPAFSVQKECEKTIRDLSDRFGMSPKARERMQKYFKPDEELDALDFI